MILLYKYVSRAKKQQKTRVWSQKKLVDAQSPPCCSWMLLIEYCQNVHPGCSWMIITINTAQKIFVESEQKPSFREGSLDPMEGWMKLYDVGSGSSKIAVRYWRVFGYLGLYPHHNHNLKSSPGDPSTFLVKLAIPQQPPHNWVLLQHLVEQTRCRGPASRKWSGNDSKNTPRASRRSSKQWDDLIVDSSWVDEYEICRWIQAVDLFIPDRWAGDGTSRTAGSICFFHALSCINLMTDCWIQELKNVV